MGQATYWAMEMRKNDKATKNDEATHLCLFCKQNGTSFNQFSQLQLKRLRPEPGVLDALNGTSGLNHRCERLVARQIDVDLPDHRLLFSYTFVATDSAHAAGVGVKQLPRRWRWG